MRNQVARHSYNKSGAGRHKNSSKNDYRRKSKHNNKLGGE